MMNLIYFILVMSVLVIVHEFGHLIVAKYFHVYCEEFSIGMGPKIISKKFKETTYSLRALPIGGFVAMAGDNENALETKVVSDIPVERTLLGIAKWKKILIMLAGVVMNFILALVISSSIIASNGVYKLDTLPIVDGVVENSPAANAGMKKGDEIIKVEFNDGRSIKPSSFEDILIFSYGNTERIIYTILRENEELQFVMVPELNNGTYSSGIMIPQPTVVETNIFNSFYYGADYLINTGVNVVKSVGHMITGKGLEQVSGPIGIYNVTAEAASMGFATFINFIGIMSLNLGILNLLPLPVLDGGRILLTAIEMIIRKPINKKLENIIMSISMILLIGLMIYVSFNDIIKLF